MPIVKKLRKKYKVSGPFPADTIFIKNIRKKYDVIVGVSRQVLTPIEAFTSMMQSILSRITIY